MDLLGQPAIVNSSGSSTLAFRPHSIPPINTTPKNGATVEDVIILGAGPVGLFGAFYSGMRGMSVKIIDSQPMVGGRVSASYPEKFIYDVAGFPKVTGQELVSRLLEQAQLFNPKIQLEENVLSLARHSDGDFLIKTNKGIHFGKTIIFATGMGACFPKKHPFPSAALFENKGVLYSVDQKELFRGKRVIIAGGGDSALDWANDLAEIAKSVVLVHRRPNFRAHESSLVKLKLTSVKILTSTEIIEFRGEQNLNEVLIRDCITGAARYFGVDYALIMHGFSSSTQSFESWGIDSSNGLVNVNGRMESNIPGIYAAGDVAQYESKLKLIVTGFGEITAAANSARAFLFPNEATHTVHSTTLGESGQLTSKVKTVA